MTPAEDLPGQATRLRPPGMYLVGLTGGIATGKSLVTAELRRLGAFVIDADRVARKVVTPGSAGLRQAIATFGIEYLAPDGTLDRTALGNLVFRDAAARQKLESILHPLIADSIFDVLQHQQAGGLKVAVVDAPVLIEAGLRKEVDELWVVTAPRDLQRERLMERDALTRAAAEARIGAQLPLAEKMRLADHVIDNSGNPAETRGQVEQLWVHLCRRFCF